jgi:hypothetical protein
MCSSGWLGCASRPVWSAAKQSIDASLIKADVDKNKRSGGDQPIKWPTPEEASHAVREYLAALDAARNEDFPKLLHYNRLPKGCHFMAWEQPKYFTDEVRASFKSLKVLPMCPVRPVTYVSGRSNSLVSNGVSVPV